ncbi:hypothetical protein D9M72_419760 [compost metagenome]
MGQVAAGAEITFGRIAHAGNLVAAGGGVDALHRHFIAGQGAGLVGADHSHRAQALHGGQATDDRIAARHALHAQGEDDGQHRGQALGDGGHGQAHSGHQHVGGAVATQQDAEDEGGRRQQQDDQGELAGEAGHVGQQRSLQLLHGAQQVADAPEFGLARGRHHQADAAAGTDQGAGVGHAVTVAQAGVGGDGAAGLVGGHGLAGERGFLDAQVAGFHQAQVRRYAVAGFQQHQVARYQVFGRNLAHFSVAFDPAIQGQQLLDGAHGRLRLAFLDETDHGVDQHHAEDHRAIEPFAQGQGDQGRGQQHIDEQVVELQQEALERAGPGAFGQAVGPEAGQAALGFLRVQSGRPAVQVLQAVLDCPGVPVGGRWRGHGVLLGESWGKPSSQARFLYWHGSVLGFS